MASLALEEKINKIRLRNEEIKRRYEEVEADKKNAAKLEALEQPIPVEDWPERKEPPEFSASAPKLASKTKHSVRKHNDQSAQYYPGSGEGKKTHAFPDGQGPPPDPKYNFLADSERDEPANEIPKDSERNRGRNKMSRGGFGRRGSGRDWQAKEHWNQHENPGDMTHSEYEAWRAERNRIDEARISRQRTAEGNWRREWDNDKIHLADDIKKRENRVTLGEAIVTRQEHNENDKYYRSPRTITKISHQFNPRESQHSSVLSETIKSPSGVVDNEKRLVINTEKSIKVLLNAQGTTPTRSSVMSVKVSPPNIAGTGRVGPRQRPRVMYSSQSETDSSFSENFSLIRQKSIDETTKLRNIDQTHGITSPKSSRHQRNKSDGKIFYTARRDNAELTMKSSRNDNVEGTMKFSRKDHERTDVTIKSLRKQDSQKSPHTQRRVTTTNYPPKSPRVHKKFAETFKSNVTQSPRGQRENIAENNFSQENTKVHVNLAPATNFSDKDDKSDDLINQTHNVDDKLEREQFDAEAILESTENRISAYSQNTEHLVLVSQPEIPVSSVIDQDFKSLENTLPNITGENDERKLNDNVIRKDETNCSNSLDNVESSNNQEVNCSVNSGLTSNDSGFIELPSNETIHDISDSGNVETRIIEENSSESITSTSQFGENYSLEIRETGTKITNHEIVDVETFANDLKIAVNNLSAKINDEVGNDFQDTTNHTESRESIELESEEKLSVAVEKIDEILGNREESKNPSDDEFSIVPTSPKDVGQENTAEAAVTMAQNFSAHEKDKISNKTLN